MKQQTRLRAVSDPHAARAFEEAARRLALVPLGGSAAAIFDALALCVPVAGGLVITVNPDVPTAMTGHVVHLPPDVAEAWMSTPRAPLERALAPMVRAQQGDFWRAEDLAPSVREHLGVLEELATHNLGEGAGYKIVQRLGPSRGTEHVSLALLTERGSQFPPSTAVLLKELRPFVCDALLRTSLPLASTRPLFAQIMEDDGLGYVLVTQGGAIRELNRQAYELVRVYGPTVGVLRSRSAITDFAARALEHAVRGSAWHVFRAGSILEVRRYPLRAEVHAIPEDLTLLTLRECSIPAPGSGFTPPPGVRLTRRQHEIAELLVQTGLSYEAIGERLRVRGGTVRTFVHQIYREYGVHERSQLVALHRPQQGAT
jgi:DNA-binding CsgD family transcriptional regulator